MKPLSLHSELALIVRQRATKLQENEIFCIVQTLKAIVHHIMISFFT